MKIVDLIVEDAGGMGAGSVAAVAMPFVRAHRKRTTRGMRKESGNEILRRVPYNNIAEELIAALEEKWSEKYKRSINCSNPKGFSQRAHCQGKKKHG
jgi:hypothetical protein